MYSVKNGSNTPDKGTCRPDYESHEQASVRSNFSKGTQNHPWATAQTQTFLVMILIDEVLAHL